MPPPHLAEVPAGGSGCISPEEQERELMATSEVDFSLFRYLVE